MFFSDKYQGKIPDDVLVQSKMYSENQAWAEGVMNKGYTIADTGNPFGAGKSVFYEIATGILKLVFFRHLEFAYSSVVPFSSHPV